MSTDQTIILGSASPRRIELLSQLVPKSRIQVFPPPDGNEAGFVGLTTEEQIRLRLADIARTKNEAVRKLPLPADWGALLTADTIVIASTGQETHLVMEKPDGPDWKQKTRTWFETYYSGQSHQVATALCLRTPVDQLREVIVLTTVTFTNVTPGMLEWYLQTGEPLGKAGGYGLQGAASLFVTAIQGSPSNVIGLPLLETRQLLEDCQLL